MIPLLLELDLNEIGVVCLILVRGLHESAAESVRPK